MTRSRGHFSRVDTMSDMESGTGARRARRRFSAEFKAGAVRLVLDEGKTVGEVVRQLDLTVSALAMWVRQAQADRTKGRTGLATAEREDLSRLRKENRECSVGAGDPREGRNLEASQRLQELQRGDGSLMSCADRFLSARAVSAMMAEASKRKIRRWVDRGEFNSYALDGRTVYSEREVLAFLDRVKARGPSHAPWRGGGRATPGERPSKQ